MDAQLASTAAYSFQRVHVGSSVVGSWRRSRAISSQSSQAIIFFELLCNQSLCLYLRFLL